MIQGMTCRLEINFGEIIIRINKVYLRLCVSNKKPDFVQSLVQDNNKETTKLRITFEVTTGFSSQKASNAQKISISWPYHE